MGQLVLKMPDLFLKLLLDVLGNESISPMGCPGRSMSNNDCCTDGKNNLRSAARMGQNPGKGVRVRRLG
jgi:hypothetical protein